MSAEIIKEENEKVDLKKNNGADRPVVTLKRKKAQI